MSAYVEAAGLGGKGDVAGGKRKRGSTIGVCGTIGQGRHGFWESDEGEKKKHAYRHASIGDPAYKAGVLDLRIHSMFVYDLLC